MAVADRMEKRAERKAGRQETRAARNPRYAKRLEKRQGRKELREQVADQGTVGMMSRRALRDDFEKMQGEGIVSEQEKRHLKATGREDAARMVEAGQDYFAPKEGQLSAKDTAEVLAGTAAKENLAVNQWEKEMEENFRKEVIARTNRQQDINRQVTMHYLDGALDKGGLMEGAGGEVMAEGLGQAATKLGKV